MASFSVDAVIIVVINYVQLTDPFVGNVLCVLHPDYVHVYIQYLHVHTIVLCRRS